MQAPTEVQQHYRTLLTETHHAALRSLERSRYAFAAPRSEPADVLITLARAGYTYSWQGIFYLTDSGKEYVQQLPPS